MSGVKGALNDLKNKQMELHGHLEERDTEIKELQNTNYKLEQEKLSLERQALLLQQKIELLKKLVAAKENKIKEFAAVSNDSTDYSESLSLRTQDGDARRDELQEQLKEVRDAANKQDMEYEEVRKRLLNVQRNCEMTLKRAIKKEEEANNLANSVESTSSIFQSLSSKGNEETPLQEEVTELQAKLNKAVRVAEIAERESAGIDLAIRTAETALKKQQNENQRIREEMDSMKAEIGS